MVSNCLADDVALKFPLSLFPQPPFVSIFLALDGLNDRTSFNAHNASAGELKVTDTKAALSY